MYAGCVNPGTDEKYGEALENITGRYKQAIQNGTTHLADAKTCLDTLLGGYAASAEAGKVPEICSEFIEQLYR
jgi:fumarate hydratase class II